MTSDVDPTVITAESFLEEQISSLKRKLEDNNETDRPRIPPSRSPTSNSRSPSVGYPTDTEDDIVPPLDLNEVDPKLPPTKNDNFKAASDNPTNNNTDQQDPSKPLSKNQQKKLKKKEQWEATRENRRAFRREKVSAKRQRQREARAAAKASLLSTTTTTTVDNNDDRTADLPTTNSIVRKRIRTLEKSSTDVPIKCIVDCAFDSYMLPKEIGSLASQISRCYSDNRIAPYRMNLWITSLNSRLKSHMQLMHGDKYLSWRKIRITETDYQLSPEEVADGKVIYLSSDSETTLETLDEGVTYIVGGIVDKNRHKSLCFNKATEQGLKTAKLPIGEYIKMTGRITLTTNQVVEIMLKWLETRDWKEAFLKAVPMRKNATKKGNDIGATETEPKGNATGTPLNAAKEEEEEDENPAFEGDDESDDNDLAHEVIHNASSDKRIKVLEGAQT